MKKFQQWFAENLVYPHDVRLAGMEGEIILSFTIDRYGTLTNLEFIDGQASESMIREVARVFSITPVWQPGYYWGRPYQIQYYMPVIFKINP